MRRSFMLEYTAPIIASYSIFSAFLLLKNALLDLDHVSPKLEQWLPTKGSTKRFAV